MAGFFSSAALADLAPGLATYISATRESIRLIISPILRPEDQEALEAGVQSAATVARRFLDNLTITDDLLQRHTLKCLSWLLRAGRIEIKVALMPSALFHPKVWLFHTPDGLMAVHGSSNVTIGGIRKNIEQVAVSQSWSDANQKYIAEKLTEHFRRLWSHEEDASCIVIPLPQAVKDRLLRSYRAEAPPTEDDLRVLYRTARETRDPVLRYRTASPVPRTEFALPNGIEYRSGDFVHQGRAVDAWCEASYRGVLEMATGSGKTVTAMICAHRLYEQQRPLLIVVAAPYVPLIQQWCDEIAAFALTPVNLSGVSGRHGRAREIGRVRRRLMSRRSEVEIMVVTHRTLCDSEFKRELEKFVCQTLLVADEVHNLGSEGFIADPPLFFGSRLGLSATPVRQYDTGGTEAMFDFFGPVVFRYRLDEAIGRCLVPYDYHIHPIELTADEMSVWSELSARIKANIWRQEDGDPEDILAKLYRDRHAVLETAANKIPALQQMLGLSDARDLRHVLVYASDKAPEQLRHVNALLRRCRIPFHQLTSEETRNRDDAARIIADFRAGVLRVLTAKRVLDEGVNIPEIQRVFILASTTVERQWIQRRGRILRRSATTSKTHSEIHDFVGLPPRTMVVDDEARTLIRGELARIREFGRLARNAARPGGPVDVIQELLHHLLG